MRVLLFLVSIQFLMVSTVHAQLSERAKRILGKENTTVKDSLVVICRPRSSMGTGKLYVFKQLKTVDSDRSGTDLVDFTSYVGKKEANFEVRSTNGNISLGPKSQDSAAKFMQRWEASSPNGEARFTVNALGHMKFFIDEPRASAEKVIYFAYSRAENATLRVGQTLKATYICEHQVLEDSKLIEKTPQKSLENSVCIIQESDPDCVEIDTESKD